MKIPKPQMAGLANEVQTSHSLLGSTPWQASLKWDFPILAILA